MSHNSITRIALLYFIERCNSEEKQMLEWSKDETFAADTRTKCVANAKASAEMRADAQAALEAL